MKKIEGKERGYLMIYAIILIFGFMTIGLTAMTLVGAQYKAAKDNVYRQNASYASRACVAATIQKLKDDPDFGGYTDQVIFDRTSQGGGKSVCSTVVTGSDDDPRQIAVTSNVLRTDSDATPIRYKAASVAAAGEGTAKKYSGVTIGYGGLHLPFIGIFSAPRVDVLGWMGTGSNLASGGDQTLVADHIRIANISCGSTSNWPQPCTWLPIAFPAGVFGYLGKVQGDLCAPGQIPHTRLPGLDTSCSLPAMEMPAFDKKSFIENLDGPTINAADIFNPDNYPNSCLQRVQIFPPYPVYELKGGTYDVPTGATIVGNLDLNLAPPPSGAYQYNSSIECEIRLHGDVYIKGGINTNALDNRKLALRLKVADSVTDSDVTVVANRQILLQDATFPAGTSGARLHLVDFYSSNLACSDSETVPSATVTTCLTPAQAQESASVLPEGGGILTTVADDGSGRRLFAPAKHYAFLLRPKNGLPMDHMSLYAYYAGVCGSCDYKKDISVGAIAAQIYASGDGCWASNVWSNMEVIEEESTFGAPPPHNEFGLLDYYQKPLE